MRILFGAGTRPELIKIAPVLKALKRHAEIILVHSGQHYDPALSQGFISELSIPMPDENLGICSGSHGEQVSAALTGFERSIRKNSPDIVAVQGDTNTALACALAGVKLGVPVAHIEAGLRSFDRRMPEEINRVLIDSCSEILLAPTETSAINLLLEGIPRRKIHVTGNTISDVCKESMKEVNVCNENESCLLTVHRPENTDSLEKLEKLLSIIESIPIKTIFPAHPRFIAKAKELGLLERFRSCVNLEIREPVGYLEFLSLLKAARFVLTDSGGVQEEALILGTPCLTLRKNTERPETIEAGGNILVGLEKELALENIQKILTNREFEKKMRTAKDPYGENVGEKIAMILVDFLEKNDRIESSDFIGREYPKARAVSGLEGDLKDIEKEQGEAGLLFRDRAVFPRENEKIEKKDVLIFKK